MTQPINLPSINVEAVRQEAKRRWMESHQVAGRGPLATFERAVPLLLFIITAVAFALSIPHTADVFNRLTPVAGLFAPLFIEAGLLFTSFGRRRLKGSLGVIVTVFQIFCIIVSVIVNFVGSLVAVVESAGLGDLPIEQILARWGTLPIIAQASLLLVPLAAIIIPVGTIVTGEGLAALLFERDRGKHELEDQWREVEYSELARAFFAALVQAGEKPRQAKQQAASLAGGFVERPVMQMTDRDSAVTPHDETVTPAPSKRDRARALLAENPEWHGLSTRELEAKTGIDRSSWSIVKSENGNHNKEAK